MNTFPLLPDYWPPAATDIYFYKNIYIYIPENPLFSGPCLSHNGDLYKVIKI